MSKQISVEFFWDGEKRNIHPFCDHWPKNELDASGLAFLAIQSWFEIKNLEVPEKIRNIDLVANEKSYHWDILPL